MLKMPVSRFACLVLGAAIHLPSSASCVVVASQDAVLRVADATVKVAAKLPVRFPNCDKLKVESGRVSACFLTKNDQRTCLNLEAGAVLPAAAVSQANSTDVFGATLLAIARGDANAKFGQTRNLNQVPGMPYGLVFPEDNLAIPWPATSLGGLRDFSVEALDSPTDAKTVALIQDGTVRFTPALVAGARYRWRAQSATDEHTGVFRTASDAEVQRLGPQIKALRTSGTSAEAVALLVSELLMDEGYPYNAYLERVRTGLKSAE